VSLNNAIFYSTILPEITAINGWIIFLGAMVVFSRNNETDLLLLSNGDNILCFKIKLNDF
jgi:hypothetical protein